MEGNSAKKHSEQKILFSNCLVRKRKLRDHIYSAIKKKLSYIETDSIKF